MAKAVPKRKAANGYKLAPPLPKGEILQDIAKKHWKLGPSIGQGGFGEIYSAQEAEAKGARYPYVIKIEPHTNGPLFVEMHFYMRNAKPADIEDFKKQKGLKTLGMPIYLGSGSHEYKGEKYRFIVMEKFGTDLWKIFLDHNRSFPASTVFKLAVQILDVLEYIHRRGYVHADIKGSNILMGITKETQNKQVYLVDFGLATKYNGETEFKANPKKAHDGTIEYLSRDAHQGVPTRRGDLEILAYNLIQWLGCPLPWEKALKDPNAVHKSKVEHMENVPKMIKSCFGNKTPPGVIVDFLNNLHSLNYDSEPDYKKIRKFFLSAIKDSGISIESPFQFSPVQKSPQKRKSGQTIDSPTRKKGKGKKVQESGDEKENFEENDIPLKKKGHLARKEESDTDNEDDEEEKVLIKAKSDERETVDTPHTRRRGRPVKTYKESEDEEVERQKPKRNKLVKKTKEKHSDSMDPYEGYTDAMKEVMQKKLQNGKSTTQKKRAELPSEEDNMEGYTESMKEILLKKKKKLVRRPKGKISKEVPVATTSKALDRKGLGKADSSRLRRPITHEEIAKPTSDSD